jgi:glycosyltransferase involved in cell wall biosynthesis
MSVPVTFFVPGSIDRRTGGSIYDRRMVEGLRAAGRKVDVVELDGDWPRPDPDDLQTLEDGLAALPDGAVAVVDGLVHGAAPAVAERQGPRLALVALVHHPLAEEGGLAAAEESRLRKSEGRALAAARGILVTSRFTERRLAAFDRALPPVAVVEPGVDRAPCAKGGGGAGPVRLLCVANLIPRKGHHDLITALARLPTHDWVLDCVGDAAADPAHAHALAASVAAEGLGDRIRFHGAVAEKALARFYEGCDLFVLPSRYEGFGMVVTEALARGLPVVTTTGGALAETLPAGAGIAVPPGDPAALAAALEEAIGSGTRRATLAAEAARVREGLPDWAAQAQRFGAALDRLAGQEATG